MKIVIVGAGAHRALAILRSALALPGVLDNGEIALVDLNKSRAEVMARLLEKSPEQQRCKARIIWDKPLEEALTGADVVGVIMPALSPKAFHKSGPICINHGFISSDNVSPTGSMCGVKIAPVLLNIARQMEKYCPNAVLVNFVNPIAVISGMINNHTKIRTLGVCQGFTNHLWDIPRIFGKDEEATDLQVTAAGVNHISYILKGTWNGKDLFQTLDEHLKNRWKPPTLQPWWSEGSKANITRSVTSLVRFWKELGLLIFSTEGDGMAHLKYEEEVQEERAKLRPLSDAEIDAAIAKGAAGRDEANRTFAEWAGRDLDAKFWTDYWQTDQRFGRADNDIFVRIFAAISGVKETRIVTSRLNEGAITGIKDREVVEYTQTLFKDKITHEGPYDIPEVAQGLTAGLAAHQTMLGDAIAADDPKMLAQALIAYPINPYSTSSRATFKELFAAIGDEIRPSLRAAADYL